MKLRISLLLCVVVFATACPKYRPKVDFKNPNGLVAKINEHIGTKRVEYDNAVKAKPPDTVTAMRVRNELIEDALPYIDDAYIDFITDIQAGRDRNNFVLDLVELGTAASVGITKGERPLQIIGVALTAFRGGRRSLDLNFYKDQSTPILITKMDGNRAKVRSAILDKEQKEVKDYPLGAAIGDLVDYYNAGTLVRAFTELQKDTAVQTKISEDKLAEAKKMLGVVGAPTVAQIAESKDNFALVRRIIKVWSNANKIRTAAESAKKTEEGMTPPDPAKIKEQQDVIDAQAKIQQDVLDDFRTLFDVIMADPKLGPLVEQIPVRSSGGNLAEQQRLQASLTKIKNQDPNKPPEIMDYNNIILALNGLVSEAAETDPTIRGRLKEKLSSSTTLQNQTP
jgi:hypothetical protein